MGKHATGIHTYGPFFHAGAAGARSASIRGGGAEAALRFGAGRASAGYRRDQADLKRRSGRDLDAAELASLTEPA